MKVFIVGVVGVQMQRWDLCENVSLWKVPHGIPAVTAGDVRCIIT